MPLLLDLFCCEGGAAMGYHQAGFDVVGVDIVPRPKYPFEFFEGDALSFLRGDYDAQVRGSGLRVADFDVIHASPPCQRFTRARKLQNNAHPDLLTPTRELLHQAGKPYVIENVPGAPLRDPVLLCGEMFGLRTYRHRLFETNWTLEQPDHPAHVAKTTKMGRPVRDGEYMHVVGKFSGVPLGREVIGMPWASQYGLAQAVPPVYTEYVGRELTAYLEQSA